MRMGRKGREKEGGRETDHLGDDGDVGAEGVEVDPSCGQPVVMDVALCQDAAEERQRKGALAAARAADCIVHRRGLMSHIFTKVGRQGRVLTDTNALS